MIVALDYMGQLDIGRQALLYAHKMQSPDGGIRIPHHPTSQSIETWGYVFWAWARHWELTRDLEFLRTVYPGVLKGMEWEQQITRLDPKGVMPPSTAADDAFLKDTRQTGESMWILIGLRSAFRMAEGMGRPEDAARFRAEYERYRAAFEVLLSAQTEKSGGYIPPALERTTGGNDWDNLLTLYPEPLFYPFDPRVTATIRQSRGNYAEGILPFVHPRSAGRRSRRMGISCWRRHREASKSPGG